MANAIPANRQKELSKTISSATNRLAKDLGAKPGWIQGAKSSNQSITNQLIRSDKELSSAVRELCGNNARAIDNAFNKMAADIQKKLSGQKEGTAHSQQDQTAGAQDAANIQAQNNQTSALNSAANTEFANLMQSSEATAEEDEREENEYEGNLKADEAAEEENAAEGLLSGMLATDGAEAAAEQEAGEMTAMLFAGATAGALSLIEEPANGSTFGEGEEIKGKASQGEKATNFMEMEDEEKQEMLKEGAKMGARMYMTGGA